MLGTTISDVVILDMQKATLDVKTDCLLRKKLLCSLNKLMDAEDEASIAQQECLAHINDFNIKFGT